MSIVDQLKNLLGKKSSESELDSRLSLGVPDGLIDSGGAETLQASASGQVPFDVPKSAMDEAVPVANLGDLVTLPVLGARTVSEHQRLDRKSVV